MAIAARGLQLAKCPLRFCGALLEHEVQLGGAVVTRCPRCERRRAGLCRDCPRPVYGTVGKALRCAAHARAAKEASNRKREADPDVRRKRNAAHRKRWRQRADVRARKRETRRAWMSAHPDRVKRSRRRYHLKRTPGYVAAYQRHNADPVRQAKKREQARAAYYARHPQRPATPVCTTCGAPITTWQPGRGRPPKYHAEHSPWKRQLKAFKSSRTEAA